MNYLNKAILKKYEKHWFTLRDAGFISNLNRSQVEELLSVYNQELDPNYTVNKWCMSCVAEMMRTLYLATKYDHLEEQFTDSPIVQEFLEAFSEDSHKEVEQPKPQPKKRGRKKK